MRFWVGITDYDWVCFLAARLHAGHGGSIVGVV